MIRFVILFLFAFSVDSFQLDKLNLKKTIDNLKGQNLSSIINLPCWNQFEYLTEAFNRKELWAVQWFNSWGKVPAGIFSGHFESVGSFQQCVRARHQANEITGEIQGQHCMIYFRPKPVDAQTNYSYGTQLDWDSVLPYARQFNWRLASAVCVPAKCSPLIANLIAQEMLPGYEITTTDKADQNCYTNDPPQLDMLDILAIIFFIIIVVIMLISTAYDVYMEKLDRPVHKLYASFSIYTNGEKLFDMKRNKSNNSIECLHGIRGLSILWIIFGHRYLLPINFHPVINRNDWIIWLQSIFSTLANTSNLAVDAFLLMGGMLATWSFLRQMEKNGKINLARFYFHRYLRITPVLAALVLTMVSFYRHFGTGPYHQHVLNFNLPHCQKYWWASLLHIQNYYNPLELCLSHSWYLSVDFQLYLLSPFLLFAMWKFGRKSLIAAAIIVMLTWGCAFATFSKYDLSPFSALNGMMGGYFVRTVYATHIRAGAWIIGMIFGYILFSIKNKQIAFNKYVNVAMWILSFSVIISVIAGFYPFQQIIDNDTTSNLRAFYNSSSRLSFVLGLTWIIFACHKLKTGGIVNWFLCLPQWQFLGRMGLSIYLVHIFVQITFVSHQQLPGFLSDFNNIFYFCGDVVITIIVSSFYHLAFETPILLIEEYVYGKF